MTGDKITARIALTPTQSYMGEEQITDRTFSDCEAAWVWLCDTKRKNERRRRIADRRYTPYALYFGETTTGKRFGGVYFINGTPVTPQNKEGLRSFRPHAFEVIDNYIAS